MKLFLTLLILSLPTYAQTSIEAEVGMYSNFIWRGTTFTENKPALQGELDLQSEDGWFVGTFFSNAEFSDEAMGKDATVTQETDLMLGKRMNLGEVEVQLSYARFFFPGAGVFDTDEWNIQAKWKSLLLELSYMDDYFGYQGVYKYARVGVEWIYHRSLEGAFFVGYNGFENPKGHGKSRCLDTACSDLAETINGAGNKDYIDLFLVNRKTFQNSQAVELGINWTNRDEYSIDDGDITLDRAKDFAVIVAWIFPFTI